MFRKVSVSFLALVSALTIVWVTFVAFDWVGEYVSTKQSPEYETVPFEFKLKSNPENVIFSEAYVTDEGKEVVKYAYTTGEVGSQLNEDITRRTVDSYTEVLEQRKDEKGKDVETLKTTFFSRPQFYEDNGVWKQIEYATTTPETFAMSGAIEHIKKRELIERLLPGKPVFAAVSTFYPDPNTETSSVDGYAQHNIPASNIYFGTTDACGAASLGSGNGAIDLSTTIPTIVSYVAVDNAPLFDNGGEDEYGCTINRAFLLFDTSSLPNDATISSASISVYVTAVFSAFSGYMAFTSSNPSSNTAISSTDFSTVGSGLLTNTINITSLASSLYNSFTMNSTGIAAISKTGVTKTAFRVSDDIDNDFQFLLSGSDENGASIAAAETSGTSQDPKLEVTYTATSFSFGQWFPF